MTTIIRYRIRGTAPARRTTPTHQFEVGQPVRLTGGGWLSSVKPSELFLVTATLPPRGDVLQYRIRSETERHERVATQDSLEAVDMSLASGTATLLEMTFGHAARTQPV
jgi:hypothetical protein